MAKRRPRFRVPIAHGDRVRAELPFSEVCCHMKVAGTEMLVELIDNDGSMPMAQLRTLDGEAFSAPITTGEAGIFHNADGTYYTYTTVRQPTSNETLLEAAQRNGTLVIGTIGR